MARKMIEHHFEQYSDDWYRARLGIPTASHFHNIITPTGVPTRGDRRKKYMYRLIAEKLLKQAMDDSFSGYWVKRGRELETEAADAFLRQSGLGGSWALHKVGFCTTNDGKVGCSPDRVLRRGEHRDTDEGVEIKCPSPWVQVEYLLEGPEDNYKPQVQGHMLICGYPCMHLWAYHPNMPAVHIRTQRDDLFVEKLARELYYFCNETEIEYERATRMGPYKLAELLRLSAEIQDDTAYFAKVF
jgi:hypothetical protein